MYFSTHEAAGLGKPTRLIIASYCNASSETGVMNRQFLVNLRLNYSLITGQKYTGKRTQ